MSYDTLLVEPQMRDKLIQSLSHIDRLCMFINLRPTTGCIFTL